MTEPIWINLRVIKAFHDRQINEHGGLPGLRDEGLLLSAFSSEYFVVAVVQPLLERHWIVCNPTTFKIIIHV